jgi:hypothetical protein
MFPANAGTAVAATMAAIIAATVTTNSQYAPQALPPLLSSNPRWVANHFDYDHEQRNGQEVRGYIVASIQRVAELVHSRKPKSFLPLVTAVAAGVLKGLACHRNKLPIVAG